MAVHGDAETSFFTSSWVFGPVDDVQSAWLAVVVAGERAAEREGCELVFFTPREFRRAHFLPVPVEDHSAFDPGQDEPPLLELLNEYDRYAVALVDRRKARPFTFFAGKRRKKTGR